MTTNAESLAKRQAFPTNDSEYPFTVIGSCGHADVLAAPKGDPTYEPRVRLKAEATLCVACDGIEKVRRGLSEGGDVEEAIEGREDLVEVGLRCYPDEYLPALRRAFFALGDVSRPRPGREEQADTPPAA
jgi:hypothetical protein